MAEDKVINLDDINYAVYKIGEWKNHYEINQIGLSKEIPVTKNTIDHIKFSMEEIRNTEFSLSDKKVNGFVAIAMQLNHAVQEMELDDAIELEEKEYQNILEELEQWALAARQKEGDKLNIEKYYRHDELKVKDTMLQIERLTQDVNNRMKELETERLILRKLLPTDLDDLYK